MPSNKFFGKSKEDLVLLATLGRVLTLQKASQMSQDELATFLFLKDQELDKSYETEKISINREKIPLIKREKITSAKQQKSIKPEKTEDTKHEKTVVAKHQKTAEMKLGKTTDTKLENIAAAKLEKIKKEPIDKKEPHIILSQEPDEQNTVKLSKRELNKQLFMQELAMKNGLELTKDSSSEKGERDIESSSGISKPLIPIKIAKTKSTKVSKEIIQETINPNMDLVKDNTEASQTPLIKKRLSKKEAIPAKNTTQTTEAKGPREVEPELAKILSIIKESIKEIKHEPNIRQYNKKQDLPVPKDIKSNKKNKTAKADLSDQMGLVAKEKIEIEQSNDFTPIIKNDIEQNNQSEINRLATGTGLKANKRIKKSLKNPDSSENPTIDEITTTEYNPTTVDNTITENNTTTNKQNIPTEVNTSRKYNSKKLANLKTQTSTPQTATVQEPIKAKETATVQDVNKTRGRGRPHISKPNAPITPRSETTHQELNDKQHTKIPHGHPAGNASVHKQPHSTTMGADPSIHFKNRKDIGENPPENLPVSDNGNKESIKEGNQKDTSHIVKHHRHMVETDVDLKNADLDMPELPIEGEKRKHEKVIQPEVLEMVEGALEIMPDGYGFLRKVNYLQGPKDIYIPPQYIRRFGLRPGDWISGPGKLQRDTDRYQAILYIKEVNGLPPEKMLGRPQFDQLTPIYPDDRFILETGRNELSTRIIDLVAPIGKGQRGMIVSPPKAGKTILLQKIANAIATNNPEAKLIVLLIDERPEEVTDMQRSINGEVVYSTFDKTPENHVKVVELVLERAMRLVELGRDVVILLDSITRLARAYNLTINPTGRTLSGGLDPGALYGPKRFFGSARNIENGGSLTIIATSLIETGSRMDEVIFEEFKGTGNMEVYLDRKLSEKRIFPAIDLNRSGTRREELLLSKRELDAVWTIRKAFGQMDTAAVTEMIINLLLKTNNNSHFVSSVNVSLNDKAMFDAMRVTKPGGNTGNTNTNSNGNNYSSNNANNYGN